MCFRPLELKSGMLPSTVGGFRIGIEIRVPYSQDSYKAMWQHLPEIYLLVISWGLYSMFFGRSLEELLAVAHTRRA